MMNNFAVKGQSIFLRCCGFYLPIHIQRMTNKILGLAYCHPSNIASYKSYNFKMSSALDKIENADIDTGKFKYILIKVHHSPSDEKETFKYIVRGYAWAPFHGDIYDKVAPPIEKDGLDCECVGGGRIIHTQDTKSIQVFGYSQGFGKADHSITCEILKTKYPDYDIKYSDEGY